MKNQNPNRGGSRVGGCKILLLVLAFALVGCSQKHSVCAEPGTSTELELLPGKRLHLTALRVEDYWEVSLDFTELRPPAKHGTAWHIALPPLEELTPNTDYCARVSIEGDRLSLLSLWDQRLYLITLNTGVVFSNIPARTIDPAFWHEGDLLKLRFFHGGQTFREEPEE